MKSNYLLGALLFLLLFGLPMVISAEELDNDTAQLNLIVGKYAQIETIDGENPGDLIDFGVIEGKPGVYWINGWRFADEEEHPRGLAEAHTDEISWTSVGNIVRAGGHSEDGRFKVRTNADINLKFTWSPHVELKSPMFFALYCPIEDGYVHWFGSGDVQDKTGKDLLKVTKFGQDAGTEREWHIDSAIYIQKVHQQVAGDYSGEIVVTLEAQ